MKKLLIFGLILCLTGCKSENEGNYTPKQETVENEQIYEPKTIVKNEYGQMNEKGYYDLIYDNKISFEVNDDYLTNEYALSFDYPLEVVDYEGCHLSGEFKYTYNGDNYVVKLNQVNIGFFYMGESGNDFFQIVVKDNQIRYWLYSKGKAELVINKIWRFVPTEVSENG